MVQRRLRFEGPRRKQRIERCRSWERSRKIVARARVAARNADARASGAPSAVALDHFQYLTGDMMRHEVARLTRFDSILSRVYTFSEAEYIR